MKTFRCDRCGDDYDEAEDTPLLTMLKANYFTRKSFDFCQNCQDELQRRVEEYFGIKEQEADK